MSRSHVARSLMERRQALIAECGLDPFAQPAEVWLSMAVAAEARGNYQYAKDCERAMTLANERWNPTP